MLGADEDTLRARLPRADELGDVAGAAAWAAFALATGLYGASAALTVLAGAGDAGTVTGILLYAFPVVGALIAIRRPENLIGWLCLGIGLSSGALGAIEAYVAYAAQASGGSPTGLSFALAYANAGWIPGSRQEPGGL